MSKWDLRLRRDYVIVIHGPDLVELRHGVWNPESYTIRDESGSGRLHRLVKRLDGSAAPSQIAREEDVPIEDVEVIIDHLQGLGLLESAATSALDNYLDTLLPWRRNDLVEQRPVTLLGDGDLTGSVAGLLRASVPDLAIVVPEEDDPARQMLATLSVSDLNDGLALEEALDVLHQWRDSLIISASSLVDPVSLQVLNRLCLSLEVPWLHASLDGPFILVGPLIIPMQSPCYACMETRIMMNLRERASYLNYKEAIAQHRALHGNSPAHPITAGILAGHTASEALNFLTTGSSFTVNKLLAIYLPTMEIAYNELLRVPNCPACAPAPEQQEAAVYFDTGVLLQNPVAAAARNRSDQ
jgi:bacteriocin biosynthesis cyclodehydratase domain-containing protein